MPASFCHMAVHIIFTTKNHHTWLKKPLQAVMYKYIASTIDHIGGYAITVGGTEDHLHILCTLPKDKSIGEFMANIKANSSKWFRTQYCAEFAWQDGYGAFSVSKSNLQTVAKYIENQEEHHHHTSTVSEFEALIKKHT